MSSQADLPDSDAGLRGSSPTPPAYDRNAFWLSVFGRIAGQISRSFTPRRVFDAGCGNGFLVESLWDLGIEAHGRDPSAAAVASIREDVRGFCTVGSLGEPIAERYDLIVCLDAVEHLPEQEAVRAIAAMADAAGRVLFSSAPAGSTCTAAFARPTAFWLSRWAEAGFAPNAEHDASYVAPHAFVVERSEAGRSAGDLAAFADRIRLRMGLAQLGQSLLQVQAEMKRHEERAAAAADTAEEAARQAEDRVREATDLRKLNGILEQELEQVRLDAQYQRQKGAAELEAVADDARRLRQSVSDLEMVRRVILSSTSWRITAPLRRAVTVRRELPQVGRKAARVLWWTATLQLGEKLRERREVRRALAAAAGVVPQALAPLQLAGPAALVSETQAATVLVRRRFQALEALRTFPAPGQGRRVTIVTDSINAGSLYGGVGTALVLAAELCTALDATLRLVTRTEPPQTENIGLVLKAQGIAWDGNIELAHAPPGEDGQSVPVAPGDLFLTTSWWTTWATRQSVPGRQIIYLLQEDERMFYPYGDDHLRCSETLSNPSMRYVVNSSLLLRHLTAEGMAPGAVSFEPAFPRAIYAPRQLDEGGPLRFFFYARPNNVRNLYWRGLEALAAAIEQDVFDLDQWEFYFVGHGGGRVTLPRSVAPHFVQNLPWSEYAELVRSMDAGLSLMYTPHPSYPPLDLAASGAVVVTNRFGMKQDLTDLSPNIICADLDTASLVEALRQAVLRARDPARRMHDAQSGTLARDWHESLAPVVQSVRAALIPGGADVHS